MSINADIIVLGAGVVGLSTARQLALRGARVTVLDGGNPGGLGSRAAAGVCIPSVRLLDDPAMFEFANAGRAFLAEDMASLGVASLRRGAGVLRPATDDKARAALEAKVGSAPGYLGRWLTKDEVFVLEPTLTGSTIAGAFLNEEGFMVDAESYVSSLLHDCALRGVDVRLSEAAAEISEGENQVSVRTTVQRLRADRLVVAAGAWSGTLTGLPTLPIRPQRGQVITVFHPKARLTRIVSGVAYIAPWRGGEILVGATEEDAGFANYTTPAGMLHLNAVAARAAPILREARFVHHWSGLRSITPNGRPWIGLYPGLKRTLLATGNGGQGIMTGGLTGQMATELLDSGRSPSAAPFDPTQALSTVK